MNPLSMNLLLAAEEASAVTAGPSSNAWGWVAFAVILAVIVVPFVLGGLIARALKMKDYSTKIGLILLLLTVALGPFVTRWASGQNPLSAIDLGIDLAGGTNMTFQVDREAAKAVGKEVTSEVMDKMVSAVSRRVNPTGTEEVTVRKVGADRLEVIVPGADKERVERTKRQIVDLGKLEFAVLANDVQHAHLIELANRAGETKDEIYQNGKLIGKWRRAAIDSKTGEPKITPGQRVHTRVKTVDGEPVVEYLVAVEPDPARRIDGDLLNSVRETVTDQGMAVGFNFNEKGGYLMQQLTAQYQPRAGAGFKTRLAVLLNEEIHSAPTINAIIGSSGVIEGSFTQEEIDELISVLNAGALQVPLHREPVSEFTVSPLLGIDVQRKGLTAMAIATVAVVLVTLGYYLMAGFVADVCLLINIILLLGAMSLIDATFTLPGLAGIVLTVGMAIDANVLIFERMREEKARGSSLRMSIKNGFDKAFTTIFDSNVTTLISAVVLYYIGTDQVKGFAVTLFIGILTSMFSAVYIGRLIFEIAERKRWIKDLKMMSLINAQSFDFLGKRRLFFAASLLAIIVGMIAVGSRGLDNLDIDFRGGSMVTFKFDGDVPTSDEVRTALESQFEHDLSLERLEIEENGKNQVLFRMRTINSDAGKVSEGIVKAFQDTPYTLVRQNVKVGEVHEIPAAKTDDDATAEEETDEEFAEPDLFAGGHQVEVHLSETMLPSSLADEAQLALGDMQAYEGSSDLVQGEQLGEGGTKVNDVRLMFANVVKPNDVKSVMQTVKQRLEARPHFEEVNTFDTAVANETKTAAVTAILLSLVAIIAYLWIRFQRVTYGLAACAALVHDVLITLGIMALAAYLSGNAVGNLLLLDDFKINLPIVAAFLTIIGYSLNDTIVVFDRIREVRGRNPLLTEQMVNVGLNQTLSRTLLTSGTTLIVLFILYFMGGEGLHGFSFCLIMGILVGTYSSIFIASPVLVWLTNRRTKRVASA